MDGRPSRTRLMHISDLHLGKTLHGYQLDEDQEHILGRILDIVGSERPDGLIIAGDVYDKSVPREDAVTMFSGFLSELESRGCPVYMISGNHDSGRRLDFCDGILRKRGIAVSGSFKGKMDRIVLEDGSGRLNVYLLPYVRPSLVRPFFKDRRIETPDDALEAIIGASGVDPAERNVLVAHQFFVSSGRLPFQCGSETSVASVGGLDCMSAELLEPFDYVALGHIHTPQRVGRDTIRYCGSPLKYSLSEARGSKSVTIADIGGKGDVVIKEVPLEPLRDVTVLRGTLDEVLSMADDDPGLKDAYVGAVLTEHASDPDKRLRDVYSRLLSISFNVEGSSGGTADIDMETVRGKDPRDLFEEFYRTYTGKELTPYQRSMLDEAMEGEWYL